jgi:catechol 2,3-dioxygenase-like lactoylglutathione lyase family enzyme
MSTWWRVFVRRRVGLGSVWGMTDAFHSPASGRALITAPLALDHVALWVADRDAISALACDHLGMHEIERTDAFTLVGAQARRFKLTLFAAPGPREPGALAAIVLRVSDLAGALADLPGEVEHSEGVAYVNAPEGLRLGLVEAATDLEYDLDHVVLRVEDVETSAAALAALGFERDSDDRLWVAGKHVRLVGGGRGEGERPLLNHLAVLVGSAEAVEREARARGAEVADVVDAANTLAVFLWTPGRIKIEYVEHKPSFSLV